jgi:hypothetical protein
MLLVLALALNFVAVLGTATPTRAAEVPDLASYAPTDTVVFVTSRIDDDFIDVLDGLRAKVVNALPPGAAPGLISLRSLLTMGLSSAGLDYETDIRSWLGDNMAFFVANPELLVQRGGSSPEDASAAFVVDITDREAAVKFVDDLLAKSPNNSNLFEKSDEATYTVYRSTDNGMSVMANQGAIAINDNALIIGTTLGIDAAMGTRAKLFEQESFTSALALLPESKYNLLAYIDTGALFTLSTAMMEANSTSAADERVTAMTKAFTDAVGPTVIGATILDDRTLTLDFAQQIGDLTELEKLGITLPKLTPIKPAFNANIPADAAAVIRGSNLAGIVDYALTSVVNTSKLQSEAESKRIAEQIAEFEAEFLKNTGIDLREDILSWLTGDFAMVAGYTSPEPGTVTFLNTPLYPDEAPDTDALNGGLVFEVTDKDKADTLIAKLETLIAVGLKDNKQATFATETIGETKALVITGNVSSDAQLDVIIAANDDVFVVATRGLAEAILKGEDGLDTSSAYRAANPYVLSNPTSVAYLSQDGVNLIGDLVLLGVISDSLGPAMRQAPADAQKKFIEIQTQVRAALEMIESATVSSTSDEDGNTISRAVITLAE